MYPIEHIRRQFLGLSQKDKQGQLPLLFDGPGGSQLPQSVVAAVAGYLSAFNSNMGGYAHAGEITTQVNEKARQAASLWLNASPKNIIFGLNSTSLMFNIARAVVRSWQVDKQVDLTSNDLTNSDLTSQAKTNHAKNNATQSNDNKNNIVLSSIEHFSHVSSWQQAAQEYGIEVRFIPLKSDASELDLSDIDTLIDDNTRLVAVSLASNVLGSKSDVTAIARRAKSVGAILSYDAVHAIVHDPIDVASLGCDLLFASAYKMGGAHLGVCYMADSVIHIRPYKVTPATNTPPNAWEQGTQSFEAQVSLIALMHYWANLTTLAQSNFDNDDKNGGDVNGGNVVQDTNFATTASNALLALLDKPLPSRQALLDSYELVGGYEKRLTERFLSLAQARDYLVLYGKPHAQDRTPTFAFNVQKNGKIINPNAVSRCFGTKNIALPAGNFYALNVVETLDLADMGFLRVGFLHYNCLDEIDELFKVLDGFVADFDGEG